jgi:hypothetical protein
MSTARLTTIVIFACFFHFAEAQSSVVVFQPRQLSLPQYISGLDDLSSLAIEIGTRPEAADEALANLRGGWKVVANGNTFDVRTDEILDEFERLKKKPDEQLRERLVQRIDVLREEARHYGLPPPDSTSARATLTQILARSEFHNVHGPTWFDRLKFRILTWLVRLLTRAFGSSAVPTVGRVFVWTLVGVAVLVLAYFIYRTITQNARLESFIPQVVPVSAKDWRVWMQEAQQAAAEGRWRDAVHLAYWAGISFLEASGMWRPDKARTPREYLRLLAATSEKRAPLSALTRNLELTWYANHPAGPETFTETVALLEKLGCPQA